jgi:hypothetical protein
LLASRCGTPRGTIIEREEFPMATKKLKQGDKVSWGTSQGRTQGTVKRRLTAATKIKGHEVKASKENPEYLVASDKTGAEAAHKPGALTKR